MYLFLPIGVLRIHGYTVQVGIRLQLRGRAVAIELGIGCRAVRISECRPIYLTPLVCVEHVETALIGLECKGSVECHVALTLFGTLGRDDDDTVGSLCAIYRGRCGILEHLYGLDIIAVEYCTGILAGHHAVYHIQRAVGIAAERRRTAYRGTSAETAGRTVCGDVHAGHASLQRLDDVACRSVGNILHLDHGNRACEI